MTARALLPLLLCLAACAPLRDHRQLAVIETRPERALGEADVALAPSEEGESRVPVSSRPSPRTQRLDDKDCLVLGRAVELLDTLRIVDQGDGWQLEGEARIAELDHEAYDLRVELFAPNGRLLLSIITPLKPLGVAPSESYELALDLPHPDHYGFLRLGILPEQRSHQRLSLWE